MGFLCLSGDSLSLGALANPSEWLILKSTHEIHEPSLYCLSCGSGSKPTGSFLGVITPF